MNVAMRESKDTKYDFSRPETCKVILLESGSTKGLALRLWGAMGVITRLLLLGSITGPPQLNEYPVDPVGVERIRPSLQ